MNLCDENNGFGPVSEKRSNRASVSGCIFLFICVALVALHHLCFSRISDNVIFEDLGLCCAIISSLVLGEVLRRTFLYTEERNHIDKRYLGSNMEAFKTCIDFSRYSSIITITMIVSTVGTYVYWSRSSNILYSWQVYIVVSCLSSIAMQILGVKSLSPVEVSQLSETEVNNVATGLAWSYYFGYLKLILPGLQRMVQKAVKPGFSINDQDLRDVISSPKVFIIIPKNCYCYDSFDEIDSRISFVTSMPEQKISRGGVQERVYKNTLYCIQLKGKKPKYIMMEFATPLLSIYDMASEASADFSERNKSDQVVEFYKKLKSILDNVAECRNKFELVLVADARDKLAEVIYQAIDDQTIDI